ncbi:hypothetical protein DPM19_18385 [Actinomadura craniellae]|uniref:DUF4190 domain-containing protein n=1 Tax=Actinomadura craniellae TaxID=2231787 RepID=A0A365H3G0_9ACTN|nr:hypothetical protein [Actinomadura craniellae]RAY13640.1 hypothetical protein DPM19_18385 [Actinomadura craniellae]
MSMSGYQIRSTAPTRRNGMAVASLALGLSGLPLLLFCGAGMIAALVGLVLGGLAVKRGPDRAMAVGGIVASLLTLAVGGAVLVWLLSQAAECADPVRYPDDAAKQECIEREFPFAQRR